MTVDQNAKRLPAGRSPQMQKEKRPLGREILQAGRYYLGGRWAWIALATVAVVGGIVFNWSWLVAVGVAPLLLGILPCAAMCALGLCMGGMGKRSSTSADSPAAEDAADRMPEALCKVSAGSPRRRSKAARRGRGSTHAN